MNIQFIKSNEKREIIEKLNEQYGITDLPYLLIQTGKEKTRVFSGSLSKEEMMKLGEVARVEIIGSYFLKEEGLYRLSFDAPLMLKEQITKNVVEITLEQLADWIRGNDLQMEAPQGVVVLKCGEDFFGCGKSNGKTIYNYIPKDRRLKK
jgi:NOL1/NOP2/fmu family ribosome biogenesis protein